MFYRELSLCWAEETGPSLSRSATVFELALPTLKMDSRSRNLRMNLTAWLPVALWAAVIFSSSTGVASSSNTAGLLAWLLAVLYPGFAADQIDFIDLIIRKLGHLTEYFVFALLILRALRLRTQSQPGTGPKPRHVALTLATVVAYAVSDELHQTLVASRTGSLTDVMIDTFGGVCGIFWRHFRAVRRHDAPENIKKVDRSTANP
jgi:VanZ family protein